MEPSGLGLLPPNEDPVFKKLLILDPACPCSVSLDELAAIFYAVELKV
jgi:hypothetical protein